MYLNIYLNQSRHASSVATFLLNRVGWELFFLKIYVWLCQAFQDLNVI